MKKFLFCVCLTLSSLAFAQQSAVQPAETDALARQIAGTGSSAERATRLVQWINTNFTWSYTDYQNRTVDEIIARRAGNCAELSRVLARLFEADNIRFRWIAEINIQPQSPQRQQNATRLVAAKGPAVSVFGLRHNDHRWLEVYNDATNEWIPADPAIGVVGVEPWVRLRMGLKDRPEPTIPQVADTVAQMIVPFAILVKPMDKTGEFDSRSDFYLVEQFNKCYDGKLANLPAWKEWTSTVHDLTEVAARAFAGKANMHDHAAEIEHLAEIYRTLQEQAKQRGII